MVDVELVIVELFAVTSPPVKVVFEIFVADRLVEVELVMVPLVAVNEVGLIVETDSVPEIFRLVAVALVRVAFDEVR